MQKFEIPWYSINKFVRGWNNNGSGRIFFSGGWPKFHIIPSFLKCGNFFSIWWWDFELVVRIRKQKGD